MSTFEGKLVGIYIAGKKREPLHEIETVEALPGRGLAGDRYCLHEGTFTKPGSPDREVTLIEIEALEALALEANLNLKPGEARRSLVTRGVPLNHLIGRDFSVGEVLLRGIRLCEPCDHLESLTTKGVKSGLCHRGGLRAQILQGGTLRTGDIVRPMSAPPR